MAAGDYFETVMVDKKKIGCDGGRGSLGHPMVYLDIHKNGEAVCPYCSRRYLLRKKKSA